LRLLTASLFPGCGFVGKAASLAADLPMEPITHFLTGACLARAGFNRRTAYATLAMTLAAETPDLDVIWRIRGPVAALEHHRGITHTFLGAPFVALVVTGAVYLWHLWRKKPGPLQPNWFLIWLFSLVAALSHILLDFTNNYGVRPFFPFNPRWYSWDIVFIFEPLMFAALLVALMAPAIFGLADSEIGARRKPFRGRGWAIAALVFIALLYGVRNAEHQRAMNLMRSSLNDTAVRVAAEPYPIDPFHWLGLAETANYFQIASVNSRTDTVDLDNDQTIYKPPVTLATLAAKRSYLGHVYLDWSRWPLVADLGPVPAAGAQAIPNLTTPPPTWHTIEFRDLRFAATGVIPGSGKTPPLTGWVYVDAGNQVEAMIMNGREQK
jgi:inner membrane protein